MEKREVVRSVLKLEQILFDKIEFKRLGLSSEKELELEIQSNIAQREGRDAYRVTLGLTGNKPEEYIFEISLVIYGLWAVAFRKIGCKIWKVLLFMVPYPAILFFGASYNVTAFSDVLDFSYVSELRTNA